MFKTWRFRRILKKSGIDPDHIDVLYRDIDNNIDYLHNVRITSVDKFHIMFTDHEELPRDRIVREIARIDIQAYENREEWLDDNSVDTVTNDDDMTNVVTLTDADGQPVKNIRAK